MMDTNGNGNGHANGHTNGNGHNGHAPIPTGSVEANGHSTGNVSSSNGYQRYTPPKRHSPGAIMPWDRLPDEGDGDYYKFLCYRDLGTGRTLLEAYRLYKSREVLTNVTGADQYMRAPTNWERMSKLNDWVRRSCAWDEWVFVSIGRRATMAYVRAIEGLANRIVARIESGAVEVEAQDLPQLLAALQVIGGAIPRAAVARIGTPEPWQSEQVIDVAPSRPMNGHGSTAPSPGAVGEGENGAHG
jgi:hypothetical protein